MPKTYVSLKCEVKDAFDKTLKPALLKALSEAITTAVNANSNFTTTTKSKETFTLSGAVISLKADDNDNPTSLEVKVSIDGVFLGGTGQAFKAAGNGKMTGTSTKKVESDAADLVDSVVSDLMKTKVLPAMVNMLP